eukprot:XP_001702679.1 predicted protein [Chlamydomonas reinhardtii]
MRLRTVGALLAALVLLAQSPVPSWGSRDGSQPQAASSGSSSSSSNAGGATESAQTSTPATDEDASGSFGSDLGAAAAELLNPRSWDVIAPEVVLPTERGSHGRVSSDKPATTAGASHKSARGSSPDPCSHQHTAHERHGHAVLSRAVGLLRGAAGALAVRLREAAQRAGGGVLRGVEHTASDMAHDLRDPSAWEENPWVAEEVQRLLQEERDQGHTGQQQQGSKERQQSGQAGDGAVAAGPHPRGGAGCGVGSLAAAMGVEGHVRALVKELHTLVATLEALSRPAADLSSPQQLQPLADGAAAARRHTEDLRLALQAAAAAGPAETERPGEGEAGAPLPSAAAAIGPWLVEIIEYTERQLGHAEELVRAALGYGEHGAAATAHDIVSAAADWVHSAMVLLRDTATPAPTGSGTSAPPRPVTGTAPAAAAAGAAPLASALLGKHRSGQQHREAAGMCGGSASDSANSFETCSFADMTVPVAGMPPTPHLPASFDELPADAGAARAVLSTLPPATLAVVGRELLVGACGEAQRLKNLAAFPQEHGAGMGAAVDGGESSVIRDRLFLAFVKAASDAHAALEHLDAHNGDAMPSSSTHVATAIDELLRCRARLGDLLRDVAEFSPAGATYRAPDAAASPEPHQQQPQAGIAEEPTEQGEEGEEAARGRHIPGMAVIQAAWSRAAHAAGALGDALHLHPGSQDAAGGGAGSEERQQQQQQQRKSSAWPFGGAEASYVTAAAAVLDAEAFDVGNEAAGNPQQLPQLPVYHAPKPPPLRLTAALRAAMQHTADTAAAARDRVTALLHNAVAAASQAIATAKAATLPRPPRHPHPAIAARKAAEAAAAAAQAAADAAGSSSHKAWGGIRSIGALLWAPVQAVRERVGGWHGPAPEAATAGAGDAVADATAEALDAKLMRVWRSAVEQLEASAASFDSVQRMLLTMPRLGAVSGLGAAGDTLMGGASDAAGAAGPKPGQPPATLTVEPLLKACRRRAVTGIVGGSGEGQQQDAGADVCEDEDENATAAGHASSDGAAQASREAAVSPSAAALRAVEAAGAALQDFLSRTGARLGTTARGQATHAQAAAKEAAGAAATAAHQAGMLRQALRQRLEAQRTDWHEVEAAGEAVRHGASSAADAARKAGQATAGAAAAAAGALQSGVGHAGAEVTGAAADVAQKAQHGAEHAAEKVAEAAADAARNAAGAAATVGRRTAWLGARLWLKAQFAWVSAPVKAARAVWRVYTLPIWLWRRLRDLPPPLALAPPLERAAEAVAGKVAETERRGAQSAGEVLQRLSAAAHVLPPPSAPDARKLRRGDAVLSGATAAAEDLGAAVATATRAAAQHVAGAASDAAGTATEAAVRAAAACTAENAWDAACCVAGAAADSAACWGAAGDILAHDVVSSVAKGAHTVGETMAAVPSAAAAAVSRAAQAASGAAGDAAAAVKGGVDRVAEATRDAAAAARLAAECAAAGVGSAACKALEAVRLAAECAAAGVGSAACKAAEVAAAAARGAMHSVEGAAHLVGDAAMAAGAKARHTAEAAAAATVAAADAARKATATAAHRAVDKAAAAAGHAMADATERATEAAFAAAWEGVETVVDAAATAAGTAGAATRAAREAATKAAAGVADGAAAAAHAAQRAAAKTGATLGAAVRAGQEAAAHGAGHGKAQQQQQPQPSAPQPPESRLACSGDDCFDLADTLIDSLLAPLGSAAAGPATAGAAAAADGGGAGASWLAAGRPPGGGAAVITMTMPRDELMAVAADLYGPVGAGLGRADVAAGLMAAAAAAGAGGGGGDGEEGGGHGGVLGRVREAVAEKLHDAAVRIKP